MAHINDWILLLRKVPIFSSFTGRQLTLLAKALTLASFPKGALLVEENKPGDSLYLIVSGSVKIFKENPSPKNTFDKESTLAYLSRGDAIGEMSLLAGEAYPYSARIESTADVLRLRKADFDVLLEENPKLGVHLSRVLSSHLASLKSQDREPPKPARIITLVPALSYRDQTLFGINLAHALVEQTRRRTLFIAVDDGSALVSKSLRLDSPDITEDMIRQGAFQDQRKLESLITVHPSGLEILCVRSAVFNNALKSVFEPFLVHLKDQYDYCLVSVLPEFNEVMTLFLQESDHVVFVSSPESSSLHLDVQRQAEQSLPPIKPKDKIWLMTQTQTSPPQIPPGNRIPWNTEWGRSFMMSGSPFIPFYAIRTQKKIDRLARYFGQKLIGLAMGSGAAYGYAIIGIVRVLEREGIFPDVVSGTSMGALIGSFYASGKSPEEMTDIAKSITKKRLWKMANFGFPRSGILTGRGILAFLRSHLGDRTFHDLEIPFATVATDIQSGREIVFEEGNVAEAVRASLSLPVYFQPYYWNGRYLVDGGLVNPVPNSVTLSQGANILISINLTAKSTDRPSSHIRGWRKRLPSLLKGPTIPEILMKTIYTMQYEIATSRAAMAHVGIDINPQGIWWWDLHQADKLIKCGEMAAEESLPKIKAMLPYFSDSCQVRLTRRGRKIY